MVMPHPLNVFIIKLLSQQVAGLFMNLSWLLIVLGLAIDPTGAKAQLDDGAIYDNYTDYEACNAFLDGDENIEEEVWNIDFSDCLDHRPEQG